MGVKPNNKYLTDEKYSYIRYIIYYKQIIGTNP